MSKAIDKDKEKLADGIMKHNGYMAENQGDDVSNKCEWKKELVDGAPEKYVEVGFRFYPCGNFDPIAWGNGKTVGCQGCQTDIRKPEPEKPLIMDREELFDKWWNDNLSLQPPLIDSTDSPNMIAKKFCRIGFYGCHELQELS